MSKQIQIASRKTSYLYDICTVEAPSSYKWMEGLHEILSTTFSAGPHGVFTLFEFLLNIQFNWNTK